MTIMSQLKNLDVGLAFVEKKDLLKVWHYITNLFLSLYTSYIRAPHFSETNSLKTILSSAPTVLQLSSMTNHLR